MLLEPRPGFRSFVGCPESQSGTPDVLHFSPRKVARPWPIITRQILTWWLPLTTLSIQLTLRRSEKCLHIESSRSLPLITCQHDKTDQVSHRHDVLRCCQVQPTLRSCFLCSPTQCRLQDRVQDVSNIALISKCLR